MTAQKRPEARDGFVLDSHTKVHPDISNSLFGDDVWALDASMQKSTAQLINFYFAKVSVKGRDFCKHFIWLLLNVDTPIGQMQRKHSIRSRITVQSVRTTFEDLVPFLRWFEFRQEMSLNELTTEALAAYADLVAESGVAYNSKRRRLMVISRIWLLSPYLPSQSRLAMPPWERLNNLEDIVGVSDWTAENKTEPIHPQTMSPLLLWSLRLVENFSDDILHAAALRDKMKRSIPDRQPINGPKIVDEYLADMKRTGQKLPSVVIKNKRHGNTKGMALEYLAAILGVPPSVLQKLKSELDLDDEPNAPLPFDPIGTVDGQLWVTSINYYDAPHLKHMLLTACLIVVCYLSGMRGEEVRALKRGSCSPNTNEDGSTHYLVTGQTFKAATDRRGNRIPEGKVREIPWTVISPVAEAIRVAELLHDQELLFPQIAFSSRDRKLGSEGASVPSDRAKDSISFLIDWCNAQAERLGRSHEIIPRDPAGAIVLGRFRRTLAWFIYRLPGGRIALGVQYGHLHSYTTDGYGSRVSAGLRELFPMEEAFSISDGLTRAVQAADNGTHASGPAASRYRRGVDEYRNIYAGKTMNVKQAAAMMRNPALRIFDTGPQILACCYDSAKALCHPDRKPNKPIEQSPDPTACDSRCANIARTDEHIEQIQQKINESRVALESDIEPLPLRERLKQRINSLQSLVDNHEETKVEL